MMSPSPTDYLSVLTMRPDWFF